MKSVLILNGKEYVSMGFVKEMFGIGRATFYVWKHKGLMPNPLKVGRGLYYQREEIESRIVKDVKKDSGPVV